MIKAVVVALMSLSLMGLTVKYDDGGEIYQRGRDISILKNNKELVVIDGPCESACTMYLAMPENLICITPYAEFAFHIPKATVGGVPRAIAFMAAHYPDWVKNWISEMGGIPEVGYIYLRYNVAKKYMKTC